MSNLQQEFFDTLLTYDFFARAGRMDIEEHCSWAHIALSLDRVTPLPPAHAFFQLLTTLAAEAARVHGTPALEYSRFKDDVPYEERVHPGGRVTLLHIATAIHLFDRYIFRVGDLLGRSPPQATPSRASG